MKTNLLYGIFIFILLANIALYSEENKLEQNAVKEEKQETEEAKGISLSAGIDFTSQFLYRGLFNEDQGFITQPYLELYVHLYKQEKGFLSSVDFLVGTWGSFHSGNPTGTGSDITTDPKAWYEQDFYLGLNFTFLDRILFNTTYYIFSSPNDTFSTIQEIDFKIGFNDEGLLGENFTLSPYIFFAFELNNSLDGRREGVYMEIGVTPSYCWQMSEKYDLTLALPMKIGFSLDNYYDFGTKDDDSFGFADFGISASIPLAFIPVRYGEWRMTAKCNFVLLDGNIATYNLPKNDDLEIIGTLGLSMSY